ncbi:mechanosensitive ion channel family protein [Lacticaseibacillus chiayiensis]|uniref:mechanosensitive ion channel family protein n=1 Tax=Lacticaseibacillus chiayiensis TaxID=2100821 RepID=UPI001BCB7CA6|nr:mechanosensitive ion channel family protein [Lacticaseibacillus chiayiensis]QVI36008.1 mechanosensitive ion channel family protein [Lacticaseibacillus chiayiensis]
MMFTATAVTEQPNVWLRYFKTINWDKIAGTLIDKVLSLLFFSILFLALYRLGQFGINRTFKSYQRRAHLSGTRVKTIHALSRNLFFYFVLFFYFYAILSTLDVPVGTLLAGAGVAGLAIGFGAQGFVNDVVTGFFILLEAQFDVGDVVQLGKISGTVTSLGLRTTVVKSYDGTVNFIPNRNITIVSNLSRGNMQVLIKLPLEPTVDLGLVRKTIEQVNANLVPKFTTITEGPDILGLTEEKNGTFTYQVLFYAENGEQLSLQRTFLAAYIAALTSAGIHVITPPINLQSGS